MEDVFIEGPFRVTLRGTTLVVTIEGCPATIDVVNRGECLDKTYVDYLRRILSEPLQLLTEEEFCNLPPWAGQNLAMATSASYQRSGHAATNRGQALRDARNSVISYDWPLKDCYEYMQDAAIAGERFFPEIYKMIETMENHLGGEARLLEKTGLADEIKFLKRIANEESRDERHAPKGPAPRQPPSGDERVKAHDFANRVLRKFEELCRSGGLGG